MIRRNALKGLLLSVILMMIFAVPVSAHEFSASYSTLTVSENGLRWEFSIDDLSVTEYLPADLNGDQTLTLEEIQASESEIDEWLARDLQLTVNGLVQRGQLEELRMEQRDNVKYMTAAYKFPSVTEGDQVGLTDYLYVGDPTGTYVHLVSYKHGERTQEAALKGDTRTWDTTVKAEGAGHSFEKLEGWRSFFVLGMEHIVTGFDHLLFLLALCIKKQPLKQYLSVVTAFTVAHSITITLTVLGLVNLPSRWVEIAIALSICYVALENIWAKEVRHRILITFAFGLIHGMGFAGILKEMTIPRADLAVSMLSFNLGIETAQLALIAAVLPLLILWQRREQFYTVGLRIASAAIVAVGAFWSVERML